MESMELKKKAGKFSKRITAFSIVFVVGYTVFALALQYKVGMEPSPTLTEWVYKLFGFELAVNGIIKVFKIKYNIPEEIVSEKSTEEEYNYTEEENSEGSEDLC